MCLPNSWHVLCNLKWIRHIIISHLSKHALYFFIALRPKNCLKSSVRIDVLEAKLCYLCLPLSLDLKLLQEGTSRLFRNNC